MRDEWMAGLIATAVATPLLIVCCGGGGVLLAGVVGAVGGWMSGLGWVAVSIAAAGVALTWRALRRRHSGDCCVPLKALETENRG